MNQSTRGYAMTIRTNGTNLNGPASSTASKRSRLRIGDRVRRAAWGSGVIEAFEADPEGGVLVVVRHPRTVWRCKPGELVYLRREDPDTLPHYVQANSMEAFAGGGAYLPISSSVNDAPVPRGTPTIQCVGVSTGEDVPSTALVPYIA